MTTKHEVIACHREHPDWNSVQIGEYLGCEDAYVRATFQRNGLRLGSNRRSPVARERERCAAIAESLGSPIIAAAILGAPA